jgi:hypothetical protein
MSEGTYWACAIHEPKSTPLQRLATAIDLAGRRMPQRPTKVVVRSETAAELGDVETIEVVVRDGVQRDVYLFPIVEQ